jgi:ribosomal protein L13
MGIIVVKGSKVVVKGEKRENRRKIWHFGE